jgi:hypothetical protein
MEVSIEFVNENRTEFLVDYGAKRKARYWHPYEDEITDEQDAMLQEAADHAYATANPKSLVNMDYASVYRLVERLTWEFCGRFAPRKTCDLPKSAIRWVISDVVLQLQEEERAEIMEEQMCRSYEKWTNGGESAK